jgi:hypothetical protein
MSGALSGAASIAIDNLYLDGNTLSSTAGDINITPLAGEDVIIDGHWEFDGTALTMLTNANTVVTAYAGKNITIESVTFDGGVVDGITNLSMSGQLTNTLSPGTAPMIISSSTVVSNLNADLVDGKHYTDIISGVYPVGSFYVQYPDADSSTLSVAFPDAYAPAALFGGTWIKQWDTENIFFRTEGTDYQTRTTGLSADQIQEHYHADSLAAPAHTHPIGTNYTVNAGTAKAVMYRNTSGDASGAASATALTGSVGAATNGASSTLRSGVVTEPRNRLVRIWKRTA